MKASQITTRNRKNVKVIRSLATVAVLTFFVAGSADASCKNQRIQARYDNSQSSSQVQTAHDTQDIFSIPRVDVIRDGSGYSNGRAPVRGHGWNSQTPLRGITPMYDNTNIPIGDRPAWRNKEEERQQIQAVIDRLKAAGVIQEPGQPATTTKTGNSTGTTTTKPKPKPTPKPKLKKPKIIKLPNGDTVTDYPDGRRVIEFKNYDTVTTYPNGRRVIERFNGDTTETHPSGYRKTLTRYGTGRAVYPDGTIVDYTTSGEIILTRPDGTKYSRTKGTGFKPVD